MDQEERGGHPTGGVYECQTGVHNDVKLLITTNSIAVLIAVKFHTICCRNISDIPYSQKIWQGFKLGGLVVGVETAKLKSANIILAVPAMCKT